MTNETQLSGSIVSNKETFLEAKRRRIEQIFTDPRMRSRILGQLCVNVPFNQIEFADCAVVLGTSPHYVDKFAKRVYWGSMLFRKGFVKEIIFTGKSDNDTKDLDQAESAAALAVDRFKVNPNAIVTVGGNNTQENITEAKEHIFRNQYASMFLVSTARHLIRGKSVAKNEMGSFVNIISSPVGGWTPLDPNDWSVVNELIKAEAYKHIFYGSKPAFSEIEMNNMKQEVDLIIRDYGRRMKENGHTGEPVEEPFDIWFNNISQEYKIDID